MYVISLSRGSRSLIGIPRCQFGGMKDNGVFIIAKINHLDLGRVERGENLVTNVTNREQRVTSVWRCRKSCGQMA